MCLCECRSYALGDDWLDLFDLVMVNAKKKQFYSQQSSAGASSGSRGSMDGDGDGTVQIDDVGLERVSKTTAASAASPSHPFIPVRMCAFGLCSICSD